jgi:hypothetical protein
MGGLGKGLEPTDDSREIVLVLWDEVLNDGDALGPESEEGDENERTVGEGEVMPRARLAPAWKWDRRGIGCRA